MAILCAAPFLLTHTYSYIHYREFTLYGHMIFTISSAYVHLAAIDISISTWLKMNKSLIMFVGGKPNENVVIITTYIYVVNSSQ